MPAAALISAGIGAGTSLIGGALGSRAAKKAAEIQAQAAREAAAGIRGTVAQVNPPIQTAAEAAAEEARAAAATGQAGVTGAAGDIRTQALAANELLAPYLGAGTEATTTLRELMAPGGELARTPTAPEVLAQDPGYQFRMQEAAKALQASAAAKGGALGGGTLRALNQRIQDVASSEYGSAFERFRAGQTDRYTRLRDLMGFGERTAGTAGQNLIGAGQAGLTAATTVAGLGTNAAQYAGSAGTRASEIMAANALDAERSIADLTTGGAAARAAGTVGGANAWTGAIGGIGSAAQGIGRYYQDQQTLRELMRNPAIGYA